MQVAKKSHSASYNLGPIRNTHIPFFNSRIWYAGAQSTRKYICITNCLRWLAAGEPSFRCYSFIYQIYDAKICSTLVCISSICVLPNYF